MGRIMLGKKKQGSIILCLSLCLIFLANPVCALGSLRVEKISSEISGSQLNYRIVYPHISGLKDTMMQQRLNVAFMEKAKAAECEAKYEAKSAAVNGNVDFEVRRNQNGVMSLVMKKNINAGFGNRAEQTGVTIDTVTGSRYLIADLFVNNADYVATLSAQVKEQIRRGLNYKKLREFEQISENSDYYLTDKSLVVYFKQGEYFTAECGIKEFVIPLKSLDGILKPQFIIG